MPISVQPNAGTGFAVRFPYHNPTQQALEATFPGVKFNKEEKAFMVQGSSSATVEKLQRFVKDASPGLELAEGRAHQAAAFIKSADMSRFPGIDKLEVKGMGLAVYLPNVAAATNELAAAGAKWINRGQDVQVGGQTIQQGGYWKFENPDPGIVNPALRLAAGELALAGNRAHEISKIPTHAGLQLSASTDDKRQPIVVAKFAYDVEANAAVKGAGFTYSKAAGGWITPLGDDTTAKLPQLGKVISDRFETYDIQPSLSHPGISKQTLQAALTLPAVPGEKDAQLLEMSKALVDKALSPEERANLTSLSVETRDQATSPRIAALTPEIFKLAAEVTTHVNTVHQTHQSTRMLAADLAIEQARGRDQSVGR